MATANLPKSGAVSRGYNFASTWEQNAPLMEQQHAAIAVLSNAVAERPFPPNLSQDHISGKDNDINASVPTSDSVEESAAIDAVLVNTHQFYKWFTDLESAMKSETEEKYNLYVNTLVERIQICDGILNQVDDTLSLFDELQKLHQTVATKTKALHDACDRLGSYLNRVQEQINSQATFIQVSLGPLMLASTFVLVGDHYQLPPLVQSAEARENGMSISLFCRLSEAHPQAISALQCQYRMCSAIMELSNALIYGNRLRCGSSEVANAKLQICSTEIISLWLKEVLDPNKPVVFINTDQLPALEVKEQKTVNNPTEAYIVSEITGELVKRDIPVGEIGIITPYNSQTTLIRRLLNAAVEIHTIDKYQGTWNSSRTIFCRLKSKLLLQIQI